LPVLRRLLENFRDNYLTRFGAAGLAWFYGKVMRNSRVVWNDESQPAFAHIAPNDLAAVSFEYFNQGSFRSATMILALDANGDAIAMDDLAHLSRGQIDVFIAFVRHNKSIAVAMGYDPTRYYIESRHQTVVATPIRNNLAIPDHRLQAPAHRVLLLSGRQTQRFEQLAGRHRRAVGAQGCKDILA
jgi:hypothetical protein